jgi:hypothetical protein
MSDSNHNGCGKSCGLCRPWKRFRGNHKKNLKASVARKTQKKGAQDD